MTHLATTEEIVAVEERLHNAGFQTGKMRGTEVTLIGVYGDITKISPDEIMEMPGVEKTIPISKAYKRVALKRSPDGTPVYSMVRIGNVIIGNGNFAAIAGPCSVESERQIMTAASMVKNAGAKLLRGGVVKYRSSPYSGWEGIGSGSKQALEHGLKLIVRAGKEFGLPTVVEILDPSDVSLYEDVGIDCIQIGEPNAKNQALLNRLRDTPLPVIHKRGNSMDLEAWLLWTERMMSGGKENIILCERGVYGPNTYTRNMLDLGGVAALVQELTHLPVAVDPSHGTGKRDLVQPMGRAAITVGASALLVEIHPNPLIAKSDGFQSLFPEQFENCMLDWNSTFGFCQSLNALYVPSYGLEKKYERQRDTSTRKEAA